MTEQEERSAPRIDAMAEIAARWGITVNEADAFLESVGYVEKAHKWCPACFRPIEETAGDPVPAYGKEYCRSCGSALFHNVRDQGVSR